MKSWMLVLCFVLGTIMLGARQPDIELRLEVMDDADGYKVLYFGVDSMATDTLDSILGEVELPPFPPTGAFEARFIGDDIGLPTLGQGTYRDFRNSEIDLDSTVAFELRFQVGKGSKIKIKWTWPEEASATLQDIITGDLIRKPMLGTDSLVVDNPGAFFKLKMTAMRRSIVPVELSRFQAQAFGRHVLLTWHTESESNNLGFEIQRSRDGVDFSRIGFVAGAGTTTQPQDYSFRDVNAHYGTFYYRLKQLDTNGAFHVSHQIRVTLMPPETYELAQNFPNPFNPETTIRYTLPTATHVKLSVFDLSGTSVANLVDELKNAGLHDVVWQPKDQPSGVYFYKLETNEQVKVKKMLFVK